MGKRQREGCSDDSSLEVLEVKRSQYQIRSASKAIVKSFTMAITRVWIEASQSQCRGRGGMVSDVSEWLG